MPISALRAGVLAAARAVAYNSRTGLTWRLSESLRHLRGVVQQLDEAEGRAMGCDLVDLEASATASGSLAEASARIWACRRLQRAI